MKHGSATKEEALDNIRAEFIKAMREGDTLLVDLFKEKPNFKEDFTSENEFPAEIAFHYDNWRDRDTYMKYVKEDEKFGPGGMNQGIFYMN